MGNPGSIAEYTRVDLLKRASQSFGTWDFFKKEVITDEHSTKDIFSSKRTKAEICSKLLGFSYKR